MQRVFITGANGWLGKNFISSIIEGKYGKPIKPLDINAFCLPDENIKNLSDLGVNIHLGDVRDIKALESFLKNAEGEIIVHLCGIIHPKLKTADFFDINYLGTKHILQISKRIGARKVILMSSNSPIGCNRSSDSDDIFTEKSDFNPYMKYGESKYLMEKFARDFISHYDNPKITIIRAPWFYGPNQPERQTLFFRLIKEGRFPIIGNGENKRSMVYTDNLVQGIILAALSSNSDGQTYFIADENPYKMSEIIATVRNVMEAEFNIKCKQSSIRLPSVISDLAYFADSILQNIGIYHQKIHVLSEMNKNIFFSIAKAKEELGYKPRFDLYEGMKNSIKWCLENEIKI